MNWEDQRIQEVKEYFETPENYLGHDRKSLGVQVRSDIIYKMIRNETFNNILDAPSGNGKISIPFLPRLKELFLVDISKSMIDLARKNTPEALKHKVVYLNEDVFDSKLNTRQFDVVLSIGILAHVPSPEKFLASVSGLVKPGGLLILQNTDSSHFIIKILKKFRNQKNLIQKNSYELNSITHKEVKRIVHQNGLEIERVYRYQLKIPLLSRFVNKEKQRTLVQTIFGTPPNNRFGFLGSKCIYKLRKKVKQLIKLAFWGTPPPPIGGMTVHIERLSKKLEAENISFLMYNFTGNKRISPIIINVGNALFWFLKLLFWKSPKVHYVITTRNLIRFLASVFGILRQKKIIIRVGGKSLQQSLDQSSFSRFLAYFAIKNCAAFIGVNQQICELAKEIRTDNIHHIPGFIPPSVNGELPEQEIQDILQNSNPKIVVSGKIFPKEDYDIYGLWDLLPLARSLKNEFPKFRILLFSYDLGKDNSDAIHQYESEIKSQGLEDHITVYNKPTILWPSLKYADVFIRPSYTDGDCNSLREALYFGKIAVASDAVQRPDGALIYPLGNMEVAADQIIGSLNGSRKVKPFKIVDNSTSIVHLIKSLL